MFPLSPPSDATPMRLASGHACADSWPASHAVPASVSANPAGSCSAIVRFGSLPLRVTLRAVGVLAADGSTVTSSVGA